jgi:hypothetical protein
MVANLGEMKTLLLLTLLTLASCTSQPLVTESDTGRVYPASHLDSLRGMASGKRDAEQMRFADAIIAKAGVPEIDASGTVYPGTVKVIRWTHRGEEKHAAMRLVRCADGSEFWQGPTPPSGFYGSKLQTQYLH